MELGEIRNKIDSIDAKLMKLLAERMDCSAEVARIKLAQNLPVYHPAREKEILDRAGNSDSEYGEYIKNIYEVIISESRSLQETRFSCKKLSIECKF